MRPAYTVAWPRRLIEQTIAEFVLRAIEYGTGSAAITAAMSEIDRVLSSQPAEAGESRAGDERILLVPPLAVTYRIREVDRIVEALRAGYRPLRPLR
jgi:hypothetical protein